MLNFSWVYENKDIIFPLNSTHRPKLRTPAMIQISLQVKAQVLESLRAPPRWELLSCALSLGFLLLTHLQIVSFLLSLSPSQASLLFSKPSRHTPLSAILPRNSASSTTKTLAFFSHLNISVCLKFTLSMIALLKIWKLWHFPYVLYFSPQYFLPSIYFAHFFSLPTKIKLHENKNSGLVAHCCTPLARTMPGT